MARDICPRCKTAIFTTDEAPGEHLCSDLRKRLARRTKQKENVMKTLNEHRPLISFEYEEPATLVCQCGYVAISAPGSNWEAHMEEISEQIVKGIVNMLAEDD